MAADAGLEWEENARGGERERIEREIAFGKDA